MMKGQTMSKTILRSDEFRFDTTHASHAG